MGADDFWERQTAILNHRASEIQTGLQSLAQLADLASDTRAKIQAKDEEIPPLEAARNKEQQELKRYGVLGLYNILVWVVAWILTFTVDSMFFMLGLIATGYLVYQKRDRKNKGTLDTLDKQITGYKAELMSFYDRLAELDSQYDIMDAELARKEAYLNEDVLLLAQAKHAVSPQEWMSEARLREEARDRRELEERRLQMEREHQEELRQQARARLELEERRLQMEEEQGERRLQTEQKLEERRLQLQARQVDLQEEQVNINRARYQDRQRAADS